MVKLWEQEAAGWRLELDVDGGEALSLRSTVGVLEGVFTPFFLACQGMGGSPLRLEGTLEDLRLRPAGTRTESTPPEGLLLPSF